VGIEPLTRSKEMENGRGKGKKGRIETHTFWWYKERVDNSFEGFPRVALAN
jgi:hypothetical protein